MSKDTNFSGHPVLSQIIKLINRDKVSELAKTTGVNRYVKSFDAFTHLVVMIYAALSGAKSIRQVVEGFEANVSRLNHLGINYLVRRSTLSDANFIGQQAFKGSSEGAQHPGSQRQCHRNTDLVGYDSLSSDAGHFQRGT